MEDDDPENYTSWDGCQRRHYIGIDSDPKFLHAIHIKGFDVRITVQDYGSPSLRIEFQAKRGGVFFAAPTPQELLGLISLWELQGSVGECSDQEIEFYEDLRRSGRVIDGPADYTDSLPVDFLDELEKLEAKDYEVDHPD